MDEFTFEEPVRQRSVKWEQGNLTNYLFVPGGFEGGRGG
jgi:hypothetical protein